MADIFFSLPASEGFLLAGGAALNAQKLTTRPTQDLDFFTSGPGNSVGPAHDQFVDAAHDRGWTVDTLQQTESFCRMIVHGPEDLLVDLALDAPPEGPPQATIAGPTFGSAELAGRKLLALFDRAAARDFVDVYQLSETFSKQVMLDRAASIDSGVDRRVLAQMMARLRFYSDRDLELSEVPVNDIRAFFAQWSDELITTERNTT